MLDVGRDQAAGLRQMFQGSAKPTIAFVAGQPGVGATRVACAFAQMLAGRGLSVTVIDEHRTDQGAAAVLDVRARFDIWQVINGDTLLSQAIATAGERLRVLPAARLAQRRDGLDARQKARFAQCWRAVSDSAEIVVVDSLVGEGGKLSPVAAKAGTAVLVSSTGSAAVMSAYLALKQIAAIHPRLQIGLVVNRSLDALQGRSIADNLRLLVRSQLGRDVAAFGWVPKMVRWPDSSDLSRLRGLEGLIELLPPEFRHDRCSKFDQRSTPGFSAGETPSALAPAVR